VGIPGSEIVDKSAFFERGRIIRRVEIELNEVKVSHG
jgi:hypothetical protein